MFGSYNFPISYTYKKCNLTFRLFGKSEIEKK